MQSVAIGENPNSSRYEGCSGEAAEWAVTFTSSR